MGLFFDKIKNIWLKKNINTTNVVVSVPDYYSALERTAMLEAIKIGGLSCEALLNDSSAITLAYGFQKLKELPENDKRVVAFIDFGHSYTSIIYSEFTKSEGKVVSVSSERFCGAREFDILLADKAAYEFNLKYGEDPMDSPKSKITLIEQINKSRKALTGNKEILIHIDSLLKGKNLEFLLNRDKFEDISQPILNKFEKLCINSLETAKALGVKTIHSVEMLGDTLRTPKLSEIIKKIFGQELSKTLIPDEFISRGCAIFSLMNSSAITKFRFKQYNPISIFVNDKLLFKEGIDFPTKTQEPIVFKNNEFEVGEDQNINIRLLYESTNPYVNFLPNALIKLYKIKLPIYIPNEFELHLTFKLDLNCIPYLEGAYIKENQGNINNIGNQDLRKPIEFKLDFNYFGIKDNEINEYIQRENKQNKEDEAVTEAIDYKNYLEKYIYDIKSKMNDGELNGYYTKKEKNKLYKEIEYLTEIFQENIDDDDLYDKNKLIKKSEKMKKIGDKIYERLNQNNTIDENIQNSDESDDNKQDKNNMMNINNQIDENNEMEKNNDLNYEKFNQNGSQINDFEKNEKEINNLNNIYQSNINNESNKEFNNSNDKNFQTNNNINYQSNINNQIEFNNNNMHLNKQFNVNNSKMNNQPMNMNQMNNQYMNMNYMNNNLMNNQYINMNKMNNQYMNNNLMNSQYMNNNLMNSQYMDNNLMNSQYMNNNLMNSQYMNNNLMNSQYMNNNLMNSQYLNMNQSYNNNMNNQFNSNLNRINPMYNSFNQSGMMGNNYMLNQQPKFNNSFGNINLIFINNNSPKGIIVQATLNESIASVVTKYINISNDTNINKYESLGKILDESQTVFQSRLTNNALIRVYPIQDF